jgi:Tol biopolymer transport system component
MPFEKIKLTSLTNTGQIKDAVISLDGKYVAYVEEVSGRESIFLRQVATQSGVQIVPPSDIQYYGLTFSNNGDSVYYVVKERNNSIGVLYQVPVLGGPSTRLIVDVDGPPSISPDDQQFAFVRGSSTGERALMLAGADGMGERTLVSRRGIDSFSFGGPAWSPDGKSVACGAGSSDTTGHYMTIVMVTINDGTVKVLPSSQKWGNIGRVSWLPDGVGLIFTATELTGKSSSQLWYLSYPSGDAQRVTNDLDDYNGVSLTADSTGLVTKQTQTLSSLWVTPDGSASGAKQISSSKYDGYNGFYNRFVWMPDDRIIYTSIAKGNPGIFVMNADGTASKQLTSDPGSNTCPSVSRDGRFIVFVSDRAGSSQLWRMDVNGDNQKRLTNGSDDSWPQFSADGQWVIYQSSVDGKRTLWKVPVEGGNPIQLTDHPSVLPIVSPDGNWISCYYRAETKSPWKLAIIPIAGGEPDKSFDIPPTVAVLSLVRWTPDGQALAYIDNREGVSNVWSLPLNGSKPARLTDFTTERIFWFDWSRDGKQLALTRGTTTSDVVLVRAQR